jgi:hypothetical protein
MRHLLAAAGFALFAAAAPAVAGSQSSNSSSNCSDGRCTRVDSYVVQDKRGSHGWTRYEYWDEKPRARSPWRSKQRLERADDDD